MKMRMILMMRRKRMKMMNKCCVLEACVIQCLGFFLFQ